MSERFQSPGFSIDSSEQQAKKLDKMLHFRTWPDELKKITSATPKGEDYKEYTVEQVINHMKSRFPHLHDDLDRELTLFKNQEFSDQEDFINVLSQTLQNFIVSRYTARSLGDYDRANIDAKNNERVDWLGKLLHCEIVDKSVILHVAPGRDLEPVELLRELKNSLQVLAQKLINDPKYAEIETVTGTSWIIAKNPKLLERLGFNIEGPITSEERVAHFVDEEREIWTARISKQDLINKYSVQAK